MSEKKNQSNSSAGEGGHKTDKPDRVDRPEQTGNLARPKRLRPSGGYRKLRSFQAATVVYDATVSFCNRFIRS